MYKQLTHRDQIGQYISTIPNAIICEVGTRTGDFFTKMFRPNCSLGIMVDIWHATDNLYQNDNDYSQDILDDQYKLVFQKFLYQNNVKIIREFSHKASKFFPDNFFDFVYIDADHSKEGCWLDLNSWFPKVKQGGILSGHDYISKEKTILYGHKVEFGVIEAVTEFRKDNHILPANFHLTNEDYATYFITKS